MTKLADTDTAVGARTVVGSFTSEAAARRAVRALETAGMPADRVGVVQGNVRQSREVAGSSARARGTFASKRAARASRS